MLSEEELTHLEQASAVATEVTSSMLKMRLELEEKRKALSLLQTALVSISSAHITGSNLLVPSSPPAVVLGSPALQGDLVGSAVLCSLPDPFSSTGPAA